MERHATERYCVCRCTKDGQFMETVSGMGKNAGTWDSDHSLTTARMYAAELRQTEKEHVYKIEPCAGFAGEARA
jgi:hypothetical protein